MMCESHLFRGPGFLIRASSLPALCCCASRARPLSVVLITMPFPGDGRVSLHLAAMIRKSLAGPGKFLASFCARRPALCLLLCCAGHTLLRGRACSLFYPIPMLPGPWFRP